MKLQAGGRPTQNPQLFPDTRFLNLQVEAIGEGVGDWALEVGQNLLKPPAAAARGLNALEQDV